MKKPILAEELQEALEFIARSQTESAARQARIEEKIEAFAAQDVIVAKHEAVLVELVDLVTESVGSLSGGLQRASTDLDRLTGTVQELTRNVQRLTADLQILTQDVQKLTDDVGSIAEDRRALTKELDTLARVGEGLIQVSRIHGRRLDRIEDGNT